jgi:rRNA maturation endonuclease Nob1
MNNIHCFECKKDSVVEKDKCPICGKKAKVIGEVSRTGLIGFPNTGTGKK